MGRGYRPAPLTFRARLDLHQTGATWLWLMYLHGYSQTVR